MIAFATKYKVIFIIRLKRLKWITETQKPNNLIKAQTNN